MKVPFEMMKDYPVCTVPDMEIFEKMCCKIEEVIPELEKRERLVDVDGSTFQVYANDNNKLVVKNSYYVGAVYIETDMDLDKIFPRK